MDNVQYDIDQWYFLNYWLNPEVLKSFIWSHPSYLYGILAAPALLLLRWLFYFRFRQKFKVAFNKKETHTLNIVQVLRFIPFALLLGFISMLIICLARPQRSNETNTQYTEGINIVLALDVSESMKITDIHPSRFEAGKQLCTDIIQRRTSDRIGVVVFSGEAFTLSPLTNDYALLKNQLADLKQNNALQSGTAIGTALGTAINRLKNTQTGQRVIILISDGENTSGLMDPATAAELCIDYNIKIYCIGLGKDGTHQFKDEDGTLQYVESKLDETTLKNISAITKGRFYRAFDRKNIQQIIYDIDQLEKGKIVQMHYNDTKDFYPVYLKWAVVFFVLWSLSRITFLHNFLED
ncbi:MAG: VWA domain-containing protein [Cytophagales bacterium]|nr:VWA domain-containing protein [Cytophaga sp.]